MTSRIFDIELECGCMYSADGGGALMPCHYDDSDLKQVKKCDKAHKKWYKTPEHEKYKVECQRRNQ